MTDTLSAALAQRLPGGVLLWELVEARDDLEVCVRLTTLDGHPAGYAVGRVAGDTFAAECACDHPSPLSAWSCASVERAENARQWAAVDWTWWPCARLLATGRKILDAPPPRNPDGSPDEVSKETRLYAVGSLWSVALGWTEHRAALEAEWAADRASGVPHLGEPWQWAHPIVEGGALEPCRWRTRREHCVCFRCSHSKIQSARSDTASPRPQPAQRSLFGGAA